jgi:hypothetical protein
LETLGYQALERFYEWVIGSLLLAPLMAVMMGGIIYMMAFCLKRTVRATN